MGGENWCGPSEGAAEKDTHCPICMQLIEDAFLTACGHSFCYMCIFTHLRYHWHCPSCFHSLSPNLTFANILLKKLLAKYGGQRGSHQSPLEHVRLALQQGCEISIDQVDGLLSLLSEKKRTMEQQEAVAYTGILLDFLLCLRKQKLEQLNQIQKDLSFIKEDIDAAHMRQTKLPGANDKGSVQVRMVANDPNPHFNTPAGGGGAILERKRRLHSQFIDLQDYYLQKRRYRATKTHEPQQSCGNTKNKGVYNPGLKDFQSVTRYSHLKVVAELRHGDPFHSANIVSSIEFDRDDELFATSGVSRCIKVFDFSSSVMEYEEHEKRAWSVDFSRTEPSMLVSGSDDCKVKIWCIKQDASAVNISMKANICSVTFNPGSNINIAVGSADHQIRYYDLRNISQPFHVFSGHQKAVSYVKFMSNSELASASTDSTLRLWDINEK